MVIVITFFKQVTLPGNVTGVIIVLVTHPMGSRRSFIPEAVKTSPNRAPFADPGYWRTTGTGTGVRRTENGTGYRGEFSLEVPEIVRSLRVLRKACSGPLLQPVERTKPVPDEDRTGFFRVWR